MCTPEIAHCEFCSEPEPAWPECMAWCKPSFDDGTTAVVCPRCCSCAPVCQRSLITCTMCYAFAFFKRARGTVTASR